MSYRKQGASGDNVVAGPWVLPKAWRWQTLGSICEPSQYGWTTSASKEGVLRFLRTTDITSGPVNWATVPFCSEPPADVERYLLADGDILISRTGSVGKSFLVTGAERAIFASYLIRYRAQKNPRYLFRWLQTNAYWNFISEGTAGIAVPNVNATKLSAIPVPVAPPDVQDHIVAKVNDLLSEIDDGEAALARADLEMYRRALLKAAVTGELTADWRAANPPRQTGPQLLARILADRRAQWHADKNNQRKKYRDPNLPNSKNLTLPVGWTWASVDQLATRVTKGSVITYLTQFLNSERGAIF